MIELPFNGTKNTLEKIQVYNEFVQDYTCNFFFSLSLFLC